MDQFPSPENLAKSIVIERTYLVKHFNWNCDESRMDKHKEGLANVIIYHLMPESKMYLDSEEIIRKKLNITYKKYLVEKVEVKSTKYDKF